MTFSNKKIRNFSKLNLKRYAEFYDIKILNNVWYELFEKSNEYQKLQYEFLNKLRQKCNNVRISYNIENFIQCFNQIIVKKVKKQIVKKIAPHLVL